MKTKKKINPKSTPVDPETQGRESLASCKRELKLPGAVYAVSVASYYEDSGELTSHCAAFSTPEKAADWFETDWNDQAAFYDGKKLTRKAKKAFLDSLKGEAGVAEASGPDEWGAWFKWKGVRTEI